MPVAARRMFTKPASDDEAWSKSSPIAEARQLFAMRNQNGDDIESLRALIAVTERERWWLTRWSQEQPDLACQSEAAIRFRAEVLAAFDTLARAGNPTKP